MNVCFHLDNFKLSQKSPKVVGKTITCLNKEYKSIIEDGSLEMTAHRGNIHNYLGMTLDYNEGGTVKSRTIYSIDKSIAAFYKAEPRGRGIKTSVATEDLYKVDEECKKLSPDKAKMFHNLVAKTIYNTNREIPDTCTSVSLLTEGDRQPKKYDWGKIFHIMKYIRGTRDLPLILSKNGSGVLK